MAADADPLTPAEQLQLRIQFLMREFGPDRCHVREDGSLQVLSKDAGQRVMIEEKWNALTALSGTALVRLYARQGAKEATRQFPILDWSYWVQAALWTLEEAVALTLGFHPSTAAYVEDCVSAEVAVSFRRLARLVHRAMDLGELKAPLTPAAYLTWAKRRRIEMVPDFKMALEEGLPTPFVESAHPAYRPESVATVLVGMAEEFAGYDAERRNRASGMICTRLRARGLSISEETIRGMLGDYSPLVKRGTEPQT